MRLLASLLSLIALVATPAAARERADLLIRHATVVDVAGARLVADQAVATEGERIVAVGADAEIAANWSAARTVEAQGR